MQPYFTSDRTNPRRIHQLHQNTTEVNVQPVSSLAPFSVITPVDQAFRAFHGCSLFEEMFILRYSISVR
jgi:hypothetical protein